MPGDLDDLELRLKIKTEGEEKLRQIASGTQAVGNAAKQGATAVDQLTELIKKETAAGKSLTDVLTGIAKGVGSYADEIRKAAVDTLKGVGVNKALADSYMGVGHAAQQASLDMKRVRNEAEAIEAAHISALGEGNRRLMSRVRTEGEALEQARTAATAAGNRRLMSRIRSDEESLEQAHISAIGMSNQRIMKRVRSEGEALEQARIAAAAAGSRRLMSRVRSEGESLEQAHVAALGEGNKRAAQAVSASAKAAAQEASLANAELAKTIRLTQSLTGILPSGLSGFSSIGGGGLLSFLGTKTGMITAGVAGAALLGAEMVNLATKTGAYAQEQVNLSAKTGMSLRETQLWTREAEVTGIHVGSLVQQVRSLSRAMSENSDEGRKAKIALKELGLDDKVAYMDPGSAIRTIYGKLAQVKQPFDRERIATTIFGRGGLEPLALVGKVTELDRAITHLGGVVEDSGIKKMSEFEQNVRLLGVAFSSVARELGGLAGGVLNAVIIDPLFGSALRSAKRETMSEQMDRDSDVLADRGIVDGLTPEQQKVRNSDRTINAYLDNATGSGKAGQELRLTRQMKLAEDELAAARDKHGMTDGKFDMTEIKRANSKIINIKQQIQALGEIEQITRRIALLQDQAEQKPFGRLGQLEVQRREMERDFDVKVRDNPTLGKTVAKERALARAALKQEVKDEVEREAGVNRNIGIDRQLRALGRDFGYSQRVEDLGLPFNPSREQNRAAATSAFNSRIGLARQENALELQKANNVPVSDRQKLIAEANADLVDKMKRAEQERDLKFLEIDKRENDRRDRANESAAKIDRQGERERIVQEANKQQRFASLAAGPGDQTGSVLAAYGQQIALIEKLRKFDEASVNSDKLLSDEERRVELARLRQQVEKENFDAQLEAQEKLLEIEKRRNESARNLSGKLFDALTAKGTAGSAIGPFIQSELKGIERIMFENVTSGFFKKAGDGLAGTFGNTGFAAKLFKGTPFESRASSDPLVINSTATKDNTAATRELSNTLRSVARGETPAPAGGSPTGSPLSDLSIPTSRNARGGSWDWLLQAGSLGALGAAAGYTIGEARRPTPIVIQDPKTFRPPDINRSFGIAGGLTGFGIGALMHLFGGQSGTAGTGGNSDVSSNTTVTRDNTRVTQDLTKSVDTLVQAVTGGTGDPTFLSGGSGGPLGGGTGFALSSAANLVPGLFGVTVGDLQKGTAGVGAGAATGLGGLFSQFTGALGRVAQPGQGIGAVTDAIMGYSGDSGAQRAGVIAGAAAAAGAGISGVLSGIKQGGPRGIASAIGAAAGTAAVFDPEPVSKAVLAAVAVTADLLKSVFGDPKANRQAYINRALQQEQYLAPPTINRTVDTQGFNIAYDRLGHPQSTPFQGYKTTDTQSIYYNGQYYQIPGQVLEPFQNSQQLIAGASNPVPPPVPRPASSGGPTSHITVQVHALDSQSFIDHADDIAGATYHSLQKGGALASQIQATILGS